MPQKSSAFGLKLYPSKYFKWFSYTGTNKVKLVKHLG